MYHQFKELADVDITAEPMEIGPTCHYVMGGVEVDADTQQSRGHRACTPSASAPAACTAPTGSAATRSSDLLVFGKRAGEAAAAYAADLAERRPAVDDGDVKAAAGSALAPFEVEGGENPYTIQQDLQQSMNDLVGIIRTAPELEQSLEEIEALKERAEHDRWSRATGSTTPAGTSRSTCATCCWSASASRRRRSPARSPVAATPATTSRARTRSGARKNLVLTLNDAGDGVDLAEQAAPRHARRAQEVLRGQVRTTV